ncbi:VWA domain-containing protein [Fusobacterium sp. PH5-44]|uniref:VWA domain-containing protein n=1 Tax=unclassified Fusobacterium TaxID=2648384 RepID=UPI003D1CF196
MKKILCKVGILLIIASFTGKNLEGAKKPVRRRTISSATASANGQEKPIASIIQARRDVELVFVVDTTGSMGGLINGAKTKIWSIVNDVMQRQGGARVKVGLVAYRDKGDEYVTKVTQLSENLDEVYSELMGFVADGGGDEPEDVRKALYEAVNVIKWSKSGKNLSKIIFLVGDARPQVEYKDSPTTIVTAKKAKQKGIIINTIQCGNLRHTEKFWKEIAQYANGEYFKIAQDGGTQVITTPYDEELAKLSSELDKKYIPYGDMASRMDALESKLAATQVMEEAPMEAKAERAVNKSINAYSYSSDDLIQAIENGKVKLTNIKETELPEELQKMSPEERETYVNKLLEERKAIKSKISEVSRQRSKFINENAEIKKDSFDSSVSEALEKQVK